MQTWDFSSSPCVEDKNEPLDLWLDAVTCNHLIQGDFASYAVLSSLPDIIFALHDLAKIFGDTT
jgi:hypothetical protein